jgi:shikimate 5-dehydrogenase/shikimate kinase
MKMILIGHRGVGKTTLLKRLQAYHRTIPVFDLDEEIEKSAEVRLQDIFELAGEAAFRQLEIAALSQLIDQPQFIVALGAGFPLEQCHFEDDVEIVWVRRQTDQYGRIFLDRPRLNQNLPPLAEFQERYLARQKIYQNFCHWAYDMPEGQMQLSSIEQKIFSGECDETGGIFTVYPHHLKKIERLLRQNFDLFELRDDLLSSDDISSAARFLNKENILLSFRKETRPTSFPEAAEIDWALELGAPRITTSILSLHDRKAGENLSQVIGRLQSAAQPAQHLKLAVDIDSYAELAEGLAWQLEDPVNRSFLPRSKNNRWAWVRLWLKDRQKLNFVRSGPEWNDQPSLFQWLACPPRPNEFAAVLGQPINHSYSPTEHTPFFTAYQTPFFAIDVSETEWRTALPLLEKMGLTYAAITSPLKKQALQFSQQPSEIARLLGVANTLLKFKNHWHSENTDFAGLKALLSEVDQKDTIVIWGGGGTLAVLKKLLPQAITYSVRTGQPRSPTSHASPRTLIWAAQPNAPLPPLEWNPALVVDLNYHENSRAKEYCQLTKSRYISGLPLFKAQAHEQRTFWERRYVGQ